MSWNIGRNVETNRNSSAFSNYQNSTEKKNEIFCLYLSTSETNGQAIETLMKEIMQAVTEKKEFVSLD